MISLLLCVLLTAYIARVSLSWGHAGGPGVELRKRVFDDELRVQGVWRRKQFERLVRQAQATWMDMPC